MEEKKFNGWKVAKVVGIAATIVGGVLTAVCDIPQLKDACKELQGPTNKEG